MDNTISQLTEEIQAQRDLGKAEEGKLKSLHQADLLQRYT